MHFLKNTFIEMNYKICSVNIKSVIPPFFPFQSDFLSGQIGSLPAVRVDNLLRDFPFLYLWLKEKQ